MNICFVCFIFVKSDMVKDWLVKLLKVKNIDKMCVVLMMVIIVWDLFYW